MFCPKCGTQLPDSAYFCSTCGASFQQTAPQPGANQSVAPNIPDFLVWNILATLLCCLPVGIAGIIYAAKANSEKSLGNYAAAQNAAANAKTCFIVSVVGGFLILVFYVFAMLASEM